MDFARTAAVLILGFLMAGCATLPNVEREKETLLRIDRQWADAAAEGKDVEQIVSYWSDDATIFPPGAPIVEGKAAIRTFVQQSLAIPGFHITWRSDRAVLSADGSLGYTFAENAMTVPGPEGKLVTVAGRGIAVWRRSPGGEWKCVVDIWNSGP